MLCLRLIRDGNRVEQQHTIYSLSLTYDKVYHALDV